MRSTYGGHGIARPLRDRTDFHSFSRFGLPAADDLRGRLSVLRIAEVEERSDNPL